MSLLFHWIEISGRPPLTVGIGFQIDSLTAWLLGNVVLVVAIILIQVRRSRGRLLLPSSGLVLLAICAAAMLLLSTNVLELFLFWQMTAICGFLLSGSGGTGEIESTVTRRTLLLQLGMDMLLIPGMFLMWTTFGSLEIGEIIGHGSLPSEKLAGLFDPHQSAGVLSANQGVLSVICLCLLAAVVGRCGLFPLFRHRDDLTGGSASVQSLIQTAVVMPMGVHLIVRWHRLFAFAPVAQTLMVSLGGLTALLAGSIAVAEKNLRRRLVFVNASLFGLMFVALGWGTWFGLLGAVGLLSATTVVMSIVVLAAGDVPMMGEPTGNEGDSADGLPARGYRPTSARQRIAVAFEPLVRVCRQRFYLDAIGTHLFVSPLRILAIVCRLADRYLLGGVVSVFSRGVPIFVARATEPLRNQPAQFNAMSLVFSSVVLTVLLLWLWR